MIRSLGAFRRKQSGETGADSQGQATGSVRLMIWMVIGFVAVFAVLVGMKLSEEWSVARLEAEASQARMTAFYAERISGRLQRIDGALTIATSRLVRANATLSGTEASQIVQSLYELDSLEAVAILAGDSVAISRGTLDEAAWRNAAQLGLESSTGFASSANPRFRLINARPVRLANGTVGGLVVVIGTQALIPDDIGAHISMLTDTEGRLLAMRPETPFSGAPFAAERLGLDPVRVSRLAERGGSIDGISLADEKLMLGTASVNNAPLHVLSLGPPQINIDAWYETVASHILLLALPLATALALMFALRTQVAQLNETRTQLFDSENRLHLAITGARCGVFEWDLDRDEVYLTESFAAMFGRARSEVLTGPEFLLLLRPEDRARLRTALRGTAETSDLDVEVRNATLPVWMQLRARLDDGTRRVIGIAIDITERKGAQARVTAAENRLRAALESMSESFVLWDARKRLVLWNRKFAEFFKFSKGQLRPGMSYEAIEQVAANAIERVQIEDGAPAEIYDLVLKSGRWLRYSERATADGGLVSVGADITAIKSQENALKKNDRDLRRTVENLRLSQERIEELAANYEQEKIRAEEANRSKSEFLANMSHELRTPLNAINGFSEIMAGELFGPLGDERYADYVKDILSSGQHLLSLINDILDMSKIEAGKLQLQAEPIDPDELIEQSVRIMRARAEEKQIALIVECEALPQIEADPRALKQVLLNLMSNAVKFTPEEGQVIVRGYNANDGVVLQVTDSGIGIAKEDLPRLGRPFEQIENQHSKSHQGSGLGLALSKSLIEMHGGTMRIDSVLGKGTTVSFCLPLIAESESSTEINDILDQFVSDEMRADIDEGGLAPEQLPAQ